MAPTTQPYAGPGFWWKAYGLSSGTLCLSASAAQLSWLVYFLTSMNVTEPTCVQCVHG